ncbi:pyridoxal-phosphate dependent enzyme [Kribbella antibiotica]|uniref:Pyridoxal-phosphate dependent enzyme n=1 Tax=Kribbella antibiotica TaxID=190195 RepID=A0A4R4Z5W9_9ACTN|nr:pyridoxal-phosphate dependent enzyme [Kribbella antibiotica]TDD53296.1 pyridoxal-phosphate dependent enzyme [Kribbella antibiotica]
MLKTAIDLDPAQISRAVGVIDEVFLNSPQFIDPMITEALGRQIVMKIETANPLRSFKGRGAEFLLHRLAEDGLSASHLVCASTGNFGQAVTYAARRRGKQVTVFVPADCNPTKRIRMERLGARVILARGDGDDAADEARSFAAERHDTLLIEDGNEPAVAEGAGTIGIELLEQPIDTVVVPVGDGALITGIGCWLKTHAPHVRVIGVCASGAPCMMDSWRAGKPVATERAYTIAEGIAVREPVPASVARLAAVVDDMVLVDDTAILDAIELASRCLGIKVEPAGAAGLAALTVHDLPGKLPATVITGANPRP